MNLSTVVTDVLHNHGVCTVFGEIDICTSENVTQFLIAHNLKKSPVKPLHMVINSPGGDLAAAFAIIDLMRSSAKPIYTWAVGEICSAGLMVFMAGKRGNRNISPNCHITSHQFSSNFEGKAHELMNAQRDWQMSITRVIAHYLACCDLSQQQIEQDLLPPHDVFLTPQQAVDMGIADSIKCW
jgi:ATP-dependent Clp protease protease subunit